MCRWQNGFWTLGNPPSPLFFSPSYVATSKSFTCLSHAAGVTGWGHQEKAGTHNKQKKKNPISVRNSVSLKTILLTPPLSFFLPYYSWHIYWSRKYIHKKSTQENTGGSSNVNETQTIDWPLYYSHKMPASIGPVAKRGRKADRIYYLFSGKSRRIAYILRDFSSRLISGKKSITALRGLTNIFHDESLSPKSAQHGVCLSQPAGNLVCPDLKLSNNFLYREVAVAAGSTL